MRKLFIGACAMFAAGGAQAAVINLVNVGGVEPGSASARAFEAAAAFWAQHLTNGAVVNLEVGYSSLAPMVLGETSSATRRYKAQTVVRRLAAVGNSSIDRSASAALAPVLQSGTVDMIMPGYADAATGAGLDNRHRRFDADGSVNNRELYLTLANAKALRLVKDGSGIDASIRFNSDFAFDLDPSDGVAAGSIDFVGVAVHEIGHALGFVSGVDIIDWNARPAGPSGFGYGGSPDAEALGYALDLFRYSRNGQELGGSGPQLDWAPRSPSYFSVDGGTPWPSAYFSTGRFNGNGWQASHWRRPISLVAPVGIHDPSIGTGQQMVVKALDLAAMDAIGWNIALDARKHRGWSMSTGEMGGMALGQMGAVPEPFTWTLMIAGFGLVGAAARMRREEAPQGDRAATA